MAAVIEVGRWSEGDPEVSYRQYLMPIDTLLTPAEQVEALYRSLVAEYSSIQTWHAYVRYWPEGPPADHAKQDAPVFDNPEPFMGGWE